MQLLSPSGNPISPSNVQNSLDRTLSVVTNVSDSGFVSVSITDPSGEVVGSTANTGTSIGVVTDFVVESRGEYIAISEFRNNGSVVDTRRLFITVADTPASIVRLGFSPCSVGLECNVQAEIQDEACGEVQASADVQGEGYSYSGSMKLSSTENNCLFTTNDFLVKSSGLVEVTIDYFDRNSADTYSQEFLIQNSTPNTLVQNNISCSFDVLENTLGVVQDNPEIAFSVRNYYGVEQNLSVDLVASQGYSPLTGRLSNDSFVVGAGGTTDVSLDYVPSSSDERFFETRMDLLVEGSDCSVRVPTVFVIDEQSLRSNGSDWLNYVYIIAFLMLIGLLYWIFSS